jgi:uncharacterized protein YjbJ (UPF0337 family)
LAADRFVSGNGWRSLLLQNEHTDRGHGGQLRSSHRYYLVTAMCPELVSSERLVFRFPAIVMDENNIEGTMCNAGGEVPEGWHRMTGDAKTRAEGMANQAAGAAQDAYGPTGGYWPPVSHTFRGLAARQDRDTAIHDRR